MSKLSQEKWDDSMLVGEVVGDVVWSFIVDSELGERRTTEFDVE